MTEINEFGRCIDGVCEDYDLCEVQFISPEDGFNNRIICEGFKINGKLTAEKKKNSACYEGYGWKLSNVEWEWELTAPCDSIFFDKRFKSQFCDKHGLSITGYVLTDCGSQWVAKETLTSCIITETGRDYGEGVERTIKGQALHHKLLDGTGTNTKAQTVSSVDELENSMGTTVNNTYLSIVNEILQGNTTNQGVNVLI